MTRPSDDQVAEWKRLQEAGIAPHAILDSLVEERERADRAEATSSFERTKFEGKIQQARAEKGYAIAMLRPLRRLVSVLWRSRRMWQDRVQVAEAKLAKIQTLHQRDPGGAQCRQQHCGCHSETPICYSCEEDWPCESVRILDGDDDE